MKKSSAFCHFFGVAALLSASVAEAQGLSWDLSGLEVRGQGDGVVCTGANTPVVASGGIVSILFSDWGIAWQAASQGPKQFNAKCRVRMELKIPVGYFLQSISQTFIGGLVKQAGSTARVSSTLSIPGLTPPLRVVIRDIGRDEVRDDAMLVAEKSVDLGLGAGNGRGRGGPMCNGNGRERNFKVEFEVDMVGHRWETGGLLPTLLFQVDSVDANGQELRLAPVLAPCAR